MEESQRDFMGIARVGAPAIPNTAPAIPVHAPAIPKSAPAIPKAASYPQVGGETAPAIPTSAPAVPIIECLPAAPGRRVGVCAGIAGARRPRMGIAGACLTGARRT
jgi:hypothetical protein